MPDPVRGLSPSANSHGYGGSVIYYKFYCYHIFNYVTNFIYVGLKYKIKGLIIVLRIMVNKNLDKILQND